MSRYTPARIIAGVLARLRPSLDAHYQTTHPGALARGAMRLLSPAFRFMAANDRWTLPVHARQWMEVLAEPPLLPLPKPQRIFMFAAYRGQFSNELGLAALLAWRGHHITIGTLPKLRSPIKTPLEDAEGAGDYLAAALSALESATGGRIRSVDLSVFHDASATVDEAYLARQVTADSVMRLLRESLDESDPEQGATMAYYRALGRRTQQIGQGYFARHAKDFDLALIANGTTFEASHLRHVAALNGLPCVTYEKFAFRRVRVMTHGDDFRAFNDLEAVWNRRAELGLSAPAYRAFAAGRAAQLMDERRKSSTSTWAWTLQKAPAQDAAEALKEAGVDPSRPFVLVCTNVPYDAGYDKLTRIFPSMRTWLVETVRHLLANTDLQVVVRAHPGEAAHYGGKERSEDNLAAEGFLPSERLKIIPGEMRTNTYGLMEHCKFGVVFSSTTGLEMAMMGRKVVVGADVYYGRRGYTCDADDRAHYLALLDQLAAEPGMLHIDDEQRTDARLFHFLLHFAMQWPYPWDKGGDMRQRPPKALVRSGEIARYIATLDALATPPDDFFARLPEFLSAGGNNHLPRPAASSSAS